MQSKLRSLEIAQSLPKEKGLMNMRAFKYLCPLIAYVGAFISFTSKGWLCFLPLIVTWILLPVLELIIKPDVKNLSAVEEQVAKQSRIYDYLTYMMVVLQLPTLFFYLHSMQDQTLSFMDKIGRVGSMGLFCGTSGIAVGHELGHRLKKFEKILAKLSLLTSLYMHYLIEHIKGHHKIVATYDDPSSARYGENLYRFWLRSFVYSYHSAWGISNGELRKKGLSPWTIKNEMVQFQIIQVLFVSAILLIFGLYITGYFIAAALIGIFLFQSVSYIEHYGLTRKAGSEGGYERVMPEHSWDSDHLLGRLLLFDAPRHSDHHYLASRKYQILRHHDNAPQMPTGYPGMILLALVPPAWFRIMNKKIKMAEQRPVVDRKVQSSISLLYHSN